MAVVVRGLSNRVAYPFSVLAVNTRHPAAGECGKQSASVGCRQTVRLPLTVEPITSAWYSSELERANRLLDTLDRRIGEEAETKFLDDPRLGKRHNYIWLNRAKALASGLTDDSAVERYAPLGLTKLLSSLAFTISLLAAKVKSSLRKKYADKRSYFKTKQLRKYKADQGPVKQRAQANDLTLPHRM